LSEDRLDDLVDLLESDSPPHLIEAKAGSLLRFFVKDGGGWSEVYTRRVNHPGHRANKFIERAESRVDKLKTKVVSDIYNYMSKL